MISAMPAVQLRRERKKSKVVPTPPGPHSRQGSVRSTDTRQRSDDERASFDKSGNRQSFSSLGDRDLRRKTTAFDDYEFKKRMEYTLYTGAVLLTTGVISMMIGIMMDFVSIHRIGMFLTIIGIVLCLIKLFASEHARYQKSIRIHGSARKKAPSSFDSSKASKHGRSKSLHHVKTPSEVADKSHRLSVHPEFEESKHHHQSSQQLNRKKSASYSQELLRQKLQKEVESHNKWQSSNVQRKQQQQPQPSSSQEETIGQNSRFQDLHYSSSHSSSTHHFPDGDYSPYSSPREDPSHLNTESPCPSTSHINYQSSPGHVVCLSPGSSIKKSTQGDAVVIEMTQEMPCPSSASFLPRCSFHSKSVPPSGTPRIQVTANTDTELSSISTTCPSPDPTLTRSYSCRESSSSSRDHPSLKRSGHPTDKSSIKEQ